MAQDRSATTLLDYERQLARLERSATSGMRWAWLLVVAGVAIVIATVAHGSTAYTTIGRIDVNARIDTPNPVALFQEVATNGPRVGNSVETNNRATYTRALEQYVLDGTGASFGIGLVIAGLFVRANETRRR